MNSRDPLFLNYMALWLCICKEMSISQAISVMDIPYDRTRKMEVQNLEAIKRSARRASESRKV